MRAQAQVLLPVSPERAWAVLLEWERQPGWMRDAARVTVLTPRREGEGVALGVLTRILGIPLFTERLEVVGWEPPRRLRLAHRGFVRGFGEWWLEPAAGGTLLRWTEELSLGGIGEVVLAAYRP